MDQLKAEIENLKNNEDKIMRSLQDLREQRKGSDAASEEGKQRSAAKENDWIEAELKILKDLCTRRMGAGETKVLGLNY